MLYRYKFMTATVLITYSNHGRPQLFIFNFYDVALTVLLLCSMLWLSSTV